MTLEVANTIKAQIGTRALYMMGAKDLMGDAKSLSFRIRGSKRVTHVKVTLAADDTYTVKFIKSGRSAAAYKVVAELTGVYVDALHQVLESETGLYTSL